MLGSRKGDVVLEPFAGSGTTALACVGQERDYIAIEREEEYYDIAKARLEKVEEPLKTMGKVFVIELNKTYNKNCLDTMKEMPDDFVDMTLTSPPYDNLRDYKGYSFDFEPIADELYRVTKPGGIVVWIVGDATIKGSETGTSFKQALYFKDVGFNLHDTMIYRKLNYYQLLLIVMNHNLNICLYCQKGKTKDI